MGFLFHGIGTLEYGERDYWPGGSFVTTQFFVLVFIPLFPLMSMRISYTRPSDHSTYDPAGFFIYKPLPLDRRQVVSVYGWFASLITPLVIWSLYEDALEQNCRQQ